MPSYRQAEQRKRVLAIWELAKQAEGATINRQAKTLRDKFAYRPEIANRSAASIRKDLDTYVRWVREGKV